MPASTWPYCPDAVVLAPSLLGANFAHLADAVDALQGSGAERLHVDVMDGDFVPNFTFGTDTFRALRPLTDLPLEAHLMIQKPERHLETFAGAGADAITIHYEAAADLGTALQAIRALDCRAGAAINPATPAEVLDNVLEDCDLALVMTINPGFGGQKLIPATLQKVRYVRDQVSAKGLRVDVEVDGGVDVDTASECARAGANILVAGSALFGKPDPASAGRALLEAATAKIARS
jgi:ribulose-phosphate 3-epimerase